VTITDGPRRGEDVPVSLTFLSDGVVHAGQIPPRTISFSHASSAWPKVRVIVDDQHSSRHR
jgi:hypothetical protein